jgi:hypothetical protein
VGKQPFVGSLLLALALASPLIATGCPGHHYYRVYDVDHRDYHRFDDHERVYYQQWVVETHRDPNREFRKMNADEQKEYWNWRHSHGDNR